MKSHRIFVLYQIKSVIPAVFVLLSLSGESQVYLTKSNSPSSPYSTSVLIENSSKIGLGTSTPSAKFHVNSTLSATPVFQADASGGASASVKLGVQVGTTPYGIYQTGGYNCTNYLGSRLSIGADYNFTDMLSVLGNIGLKSDGDDSICFNVYNVNGPDPTLYFRFHDTQVTGTPLMINNAGVKTPIFETERLKITQNPGSNYVLISDNEGNASWANPGSYNDNDWFFNHDNNLYAGAPKVGVGTMTPIHPFQCNGNLLVSGFSSKLIFSDDSTDSVGEYTIGYRNSGLAFLKPWSDDNIESVPDYYNLFIHDNRKVGIGTNSPRAKLEITMDNTEELPYGIILNQKSDSVKVNEIRFDMDDQEHWAVGHRFWRDTLEAFFIWNEARTVSSLFVEAESGNVGIENHYPVATLDVNGSFKASRAGIGTAPPDADSTWKLYVEGGIMARELKITINSFPDYVFLPSHKLMPLGDLDQFIREHNHLPGIPSEAEVTANDGIEVGQMQAKLLEKIEEQTLYIIALQRQIDELKQTVSSLNSDKP